MILDSFGIGSSQDAEIFGDQGANTLGHIAKACFEGKANNKDRKGPLYLPNLVSLGLAQAAKFSAGEIPLGLNYNSKIIGSYAYASEISSGKDTISGHWEIVGTPVLFEWDYFKDKNNSFPQKFIEKIVKKNNLAGYLGNCHASGTEIINLLGEEHMKTEKPIFYTSADSVFQIACHEETFGLQRLYAISKIIRKELNDSNYNICRVISRPFIGDKTGSFERTDNRFDFPIYPPSPTILEKLINEKNGTVISIGKISDIYANQGITQKIKASGLDMLFDVTINQIKKAPDNSIVFTNFVDFDSLWGHRRDIIGYALGLELFDRRLVEITKLLKEKDILILTADHGCDPSWKGTDHTRENVPILIYGINIKPQFLGYRDTFADIGQTIANYFGLSSMPYGKNMLHIL